LGYLELRKISSMPFTNILAAGWQIGWVGAAHF
jgi:hypothetical protein